jgi:hypothetical protein
MKVKRGKQMSRTNAEWKDVRALPRTFLHNALQILRD